MHFRKYLLSEKFFKNSVYLLVFRYHCQRHTYKFIWQNIVANFGDRYKISCSGVQYFADDYRFVWCMLHFSNPGAVTEAVVTVRWFQLLGWETFRLWKMAHINNEEVIHLYTVYVIIPGCFITTWISRIRRSVAKERESECTMESSTDSSARIKICCFKVSIVDPSVEVN